MKETKKRTFTLDHGCPSRPVFPSEVTFLRAPERTQSPVAEQPVTPNGRGKVPRLSSEAVRYALWEVGVACSAVALLTFCFTYYLTR